MNSRIFRGFSLATLALALAACSSVPLDETRGTDTDTRGAVDPTTGLVMDPFDPASPLARDRSVYFDFDSYVVADQYRDLVDMHAGYLRDNSNQNIRIEGHADERGGTEYNLALGQRRSEAVAQMMNLLGVNRGQIETISFGKERPQALGNTEADYAENRRADIVYQQ